jgi:hypothetical protein
MAAVCLLPLPVVLIPLARRAPLLAARLGTHRVVALGLALSGTGMLVLSRLALDTPYWFLAVGLVVFAAGMGLAGTPATTAIVSSLPRSQQGVASAVNDASRELGSVLGIAILGSVLNAAYRDGLAPATDGLPPQAAEAAQSSIAFIERGADQLAAMGPAGDRLATAAQQSFVDATGTAFLVAAGVLLLGAVAVWFRAPRDGVVHGAVEDGEPAEAETWTNRRRLGSPAVREEESSRPGPGDSRDPAQDLLNSVGRAPSPHGHRVPLLRE